MRLAIPDTAIQLKQSRATRHLKAFRFRTDRWRVTVPHDVIEAFPNMGLDAFVDPKEKALYLSFGTPEKTTFKVNQKNGYVSCKQLYEWASNAEVALYDDYGYVDYVIDKKSKLVRLSLRRD